MLCSEECLGENPKGFPTQRVAPREEGQRRWVGGFSTRASLLLLLCDPLVRTLRVCLLFACERMCCTLFCFVRYWFITLSCLAGFAAISVILLHVNYI